MKKTASLFTLLLLLTTFQKAFALDDIFRFCLASDNAEQIYRCVKNSALTIQDEVGYRHNLISLNVLLAEDRKLGLASYEITHRINNSNCNDTNSLINEREIINNKREAVQNAIVEVRDNIRFSLNRFNEGFEFFLQYIENNYDNNLQVELFRARKNWDVSVQRVVGTNASLFGFCGIAANGSQCDAVEGFNHYTLSDDQSIDRVSLPIAVLARTTDYPNNPSHDRVLSTFSAYHGVRDFLLDLEDSYSSLQTCDAYSLNPPAYSNYLQNFINGRQNLRSTQIQDRSLKREVYLEALDAFNNQ